MDRIVVIGRQRSQARLPTHLRERLRRLVEHAGGGSRAILRIERSQQDTLVPLVLERCNLARDRWLAIAHGVAHPPLRDRKSVVEGKSGAVRVDLGGRRYIKKKKKKNKK